MGRAGRSSPSIVALPKALFNKIEEDDSTQPGGVHDLQARSYGCQYRSLVLCSDTDGGVDNDFSDFVRPEHYIRHIGEFLFWAPYLSRNLTQVTAEPLESDLARQVEYDMDEQG